MTCGGTKSPSNYGTKKIRKVTHCIFDLDGTVLNSEAMYHEVLAKICQKYGKVYSKEMQKRMLGGTDRQISESVVKELKLDVPVDKFESELLQISEKVLPTAPLQEGVERLMNHLRDNRIPVALATNSTSSQVREHAKAKPELFSIFHHVVTATDPCVCRGKPYPDLYLTAAQRFCDCPNPAQCLVFEDSPVGLQAGLAAGMQVVLTPHSSIEQRYADQATMVLPSLLDFQPQLFGLPPFEDDCKPKVGRCPPPVGFKPPPSACDPCGLSRRSTCPPYKHESKCTLSIFENKAVLITMLISIICGILYRLW